MTTMILLVTRIATKMFGSTATLVTDVHEDVNELRLGTSQGTDIFDRPYSVMRAYNHVGKEIAEIPIDGVVEFKMKTAVLTTPRQLKADDATTT